MNYLSGSSFFRTETSRIDSVEREFPRTGASHSCFRFRKNFIDEEGWTCIHIALDIEEHLYMIFSLERSWRNFCMREDCNDFHVAVALLNCGSHKKHHFQSPEQFCEKWDSHGVGAMDTLTTLLVRVSDFTPESLGSMPDATKYPPVHTEYVLVKSVGPKVLYPESRVQGTGEYFPPLQFHV
ncbi:hypothetical protein TNCV_1127251 [Trichonephila clavipes]|nr:hypothetical protein TNCV_1127251 [Trichonephila clavipes]